MKKVINDVRLSDSPELLEYLRKRASSYRFGVAFEFNLAAERFVLKLRSLDFPATGWPVFYVKFTHQIQHGEIAPLQETLPCKSFLAGVDVDILDLMNANAKLLFIIQVISKVLSFGLSVDDSNLKVVNAVSHLLEAEGEKLPIELLSTLNGGNLYKVVFTVENKSRLSLFIQSVNGTFSQTFEVLELDEYGDALFLAGRMTYSKSSIRIYPRRSSVGQAMLARYRVRLSQRGFFVEGQNCISIPTSLMT